MTDSSGTLPLPATSFERLIMIKYLLPSLVATLVLGTVALSAQTPPPPPPAASKTQAEPYVMAAGQSDLYEIQSSQIAVQKSTNPAIRRYAAMLIKHHQRTTAATLAAAKKSGFTPTMPTLEAGATASLNELQSAAAADFDGLYIGQQVPAHQAALDLHQSYGATGDQAPLRMSAKKAVPIVKQHLAIAEKLQAGGHASQKSM